MISISQSISILLGVSILSSVSVHNVVHSWTVPAAVTTTTTRRTSSANANTSSIHQSTLLLRHHHHHQLPISTALYAFGTKEKTDDTTTASTTTTTTSPTDLSSKSIEETTEQYGLEAGLFQSLQKKDGGQSAKDLLAKYGVAYLATSIPLAIVSFAICYVLVDSGVDVGSLLGNIGLEVNENGEKVGTFAIAYAAHKAASPIRFPPTVLLTPVVAKLIGKEPAEVVEESSE